MKAGLLTILLVGVGPLSAQQNCELGSHAPSTPTARFQDQNDGTVVDTQSRLMWMRCSVGQTWAGAVCSGSPAVHDWQSAAKLASEVNQSGIYFYKDWRIPRIAELATIAERQCENPRINAAIFPGTAPALYWTASSRKSEPSGEFAFVLSFGAEGVRYVSKQEAAYVRLVRSAE